MLKKPKKKTPAAPYDPLKPRFKTQAGFNNAVKRGAQAQIQPLMQDVNQQISEATGGHKTREQDLNNWYDYELNARKAGQSQLGEALKGIMGNLPTLTGGASGGLAAALRESANNEAAQANALGVMMPGQSPDLNNVLASYGTAGQMGLGGDIAGILGRSAAETGITGIAGREAHTEEGQRFKALMDQLTNARSDIRARIPGIRQQVAQDLQQQELGRAGQAFQQDLASEQFGETKRTNRFNERMGRRQEGLAEDQFGETRKQNKHARKMDRARLKLDQGQLQLAREELKQKVLQAQGTAEGETLKQDAERFDKAAQWLEGYLAPNDRDESPVKDPTSGEDTGKSRFDAKLWRHNRRFDEALELIMSKFGMSRGTAYRILGTSSIPEWRREAMRRADAWAMRNRPH